MPQDGTDLFAKEFGQEIITQPKIKLTRLSIPEDIQVVPVSYTHLTLPTSDLV